MATEFNEARWFSREFDTIEGAKADCETPFFAQYGVFKTPDGKFVHANLRLTEWSDQEASTIHDTVLKMVGYRLVAWTTALFGWKDYTP